MYDIIIIGGGPSGMSAALYALRFNKTVLILEKESFGGQIASSPRVENYPSHKSISGLELANSMFDQILDLGASFELEEVTGITKENDIFSVKTNYGVHQSKVVIIANGVKHRKLNIENEENLLGKGVYYCAVCDGPMFKGLEVNVLGDANSALQYALMLSNYCPKVNLLTLFDKLFAEPFLIDRVKNTNNIHITHNLNLKKFIGEDHLEALIFENTKTKTELKINTDNLFVAIGQIPDNEKFSNLLDLENGYIVTNDNMETKTPGLFAVGDTRKKEVRQVITATSDGAIAATKALYYLS